jgi:Ner family transcriptional regulator
MYNPMTLIDAPTDPKARRAWIIYRLRLKGYTLGSLARELGVARGVPGNALRGPYPRMERAIATALGLQPQQIWPERYDASGQPNRRMGRPRKNNPTHGANVTTAPRGGANSKRKGVA